MLLAQITEGTVTSRPIFRLSSKLVSMECNCIDSGVRYKLYFTHPVIMYYAARFCAVGTRHYFFGELNISAYTFEDSPKAFSSIRMKVSAIRPILEVNEEGVVQQNLAIRVDASTYPLDHRFLKLKFILYKFVWENINNDEIVERKDSAVETFALNLSDMYEHLAENGLIVREYNPIHVLERMVRRNIQNNRNRPVPRVLTIEYVYNPEVRRTDWFHAALSLDVLVNDELAIPAHVFVPEDVPIANNTA